jgi:Ser/Thr protein kinase RdoA (MazF antagonist)
MPQSPPTAHRPPTLALLGLPDIIADAWQRYDHSRHIKHISDISARVSTNHVYKVTFTDRTFVIAKLSYFGEYAHFVEDHSIINVLANNLPAPYERVLARSLIKGNHLYTYRCHTPPVDVWVVFYNPVQTDRRLPRRLNEEQIENLGRHMAHFHQACGQVANTLSPSSKTLHSDLEHLLRLLDTDLGQYEHRGHLSALRAQCDHFFEQAEQLGLSQFPVLPVFVDWNIGNFSLAKSGRIFSRWDYDWFRMSSRMMDFYFLSRVVSDIGDRTVFSYTVSPMMEDRFLRFLRAYHAASPLTEAEVRFLKEAYRFFILNYVIKDGRYFFHEVYATKLQMEAHQRYLPQLDEHFDVDRLLRALW